MKTCYEITCSRCPNWHGEADSIDSARLIAWTHELSQHGGTITTRTEKIKGVSC